MSSQTSEPTRERHPTGEDGRSRDRSRPEPPDPLPVPVVDNHCHLDIADGPEGQWLGVEEALAMARRVGVTRIVQIGCDLAGARWSVEIAERYDALVAGVAIHPNEAPTLAENGELDAALAEIDELAGSSDRVRVIGETGLDYYRTGREGWQVQEHAFRAHIALAKRHGLALQIHDRDAHEDILRVLAEEGSPDWVVLHCFSGDAEMAAECVRRGYFVSFAGTVTFKNAGELREALAVVPQAQLLVETDAPYLTPTPHRGRPNASYLVPWTVRRMAEAKGVDVPTLCTAIQATTERVFGHW